MKKWLLSNAYKKYLTPEARKKARQYFARQWHYGLRVRWRKSWEEVKYIQSRKIIYKTKELFKEGLL